LAFVEGRSKKPAFLAGAVYYIKTFSLNLSMAFNSIRVKKLEHPDACLEAPPSKAYTLRALFISSLAEGKSRLIKALHAEDQRHAAEALSKTGAKIKFHDNDFLVEGNNGSPKAPAETLFIGNSGVSARFLASYATLASGKTVVDGSERMRQRPIEPLLEALRKLGAEARSLNKGCPPFEITGMSLEGGRTEVDASESSQYVSSLLVAAPYAKRDVEIMVKGKASSTPYIDMTMECMNDFGAESRKSGSSYLVKAGKGYRGREYSIEGDYSSASYFFAAAALTGGEVRVENLKKGSLQPDSVFPELMRRMGCSVSSGNGFVEIEGGTLRGIDVNLSDSPDIVPTLAVVAALAEGKTTIRGVEHLRIKESDRIKAVCTELKKAGVKAEELKDGMVIEGTTAERIKETRIDTYNDHRIAMSFSVLGLATGKLTIMNPKCVDKSFPMFYTMLSSLEAGP
jgi:3-phosphoshikimate 1-carboxyvinyltransferase